MVLSKKNGSIRVQIYGIYFSEFIYFTKHSNVRCRYRITNKQLHSIVMQPSIFISYASGAFFSLDAGVFFSYSTKCSLQASGFFNNAIKSILQFASKCILQLCNKVYLSVMHASAFFSYATKCICQLCMQVYSSGVHLRRSEHLRLLAPFSCRATREVDRWGTDRTRGLGQKFSSNL